MVSISIHAPREGSDSAYIDLISGLDVISIHAPREGSDNIRHKSRIINKRFQSTLPARGATSPIPFR